MILFIINKIIRPIYDIFKKKQLFATNTNNIKRYFLKRYIAKTYIITCKSDPHNIHRGNDNRSLKQSSPNKRAETVRTRIAGRRAACHYRAAI